MDFESALKYLDSFVSHEKKRDPVYDEANFDLKRVKKFLDDYGVAYGSVKYVHVAGSKGKGTVSSMIAGYLYKAGYKVGLYTSPHVVDIRERFWFNGEIIGRDEFVDAVFDFKNFADSAGCDLTHFEILTVIALRLFVSAGVDYAVLEVGLGGRLDATNVILPEIAVLTRVELEHTAILGYTISEILDEKLGIVKKGVPLVIGIQSAEVRDIIEQKLRGESDLHFVEGENESALIDNSRLVFLVLRKLLGDVDRDIFDKLFKNFRLIGRFDVREIQGKTVVFDVAHTVSSVANLCGELKRTFPHQRFVFLMTILQDKDLTGVLNLVGRLALRIVFTYVAAGGRGVSEVEFKKAPIDVPCDLTFKADPLLAFSKLLENLKDDQVLVVTGSNYLVGKILIEIT